MLCLLILFLLFHLGVPGQCEIFIILGRLEIEKQKNEKTINKILIKTQKVTMVLLIEYIKNINKYGYSYFKILNLEKQTLSIAKTSKKLIDHPCIIKFIRYSITNFKKQ